MTKRLCAAFVTFLLLAAPWHAQADVPSDLLKCSAISNSIQRLECFDGIANKLQSEADKEAADQLQQAKPADKSAWVVDISKSKIDDSTNVFLTTTSIESVRGRYNRTSSPKLILRCMENTTASMIIFDGLFMSDIQGQGRVTFRLDKNKAFTKSMRASADHEALGLWSGGSAIPFIKSLFGGSTLLVRATPYNESSVTFTFDIAGLEEAVKPLRQACNW